MNEWLVSAQTVLLAHAIPFAYRLLGAVALWIFGTIAIRGIRRVVHIALQRRKLDPMLSRYAESTLNILLKLLLLLTIFSVFGVETTSFAAVLAAAGIAIGAAWSGLLSNFAAGIFLLTLRPFKVGDLIVAGGTMGFVQEVGLFVTTIDTLQNVRVYIGNSRLLSENLQNHSTNPFTRVDCKVILPHGIDAREAIRVLNERVLKVPNVVDKPAPMIGIQEFTVHGPLISVQPFCAPEYYPSVLFETNLVIREVFAEAGYPVPEQHHVFRAAA